jgi:hypothetical protein
VLADESPAAVAPIAIGATALAGESSGSNGKDGDASEAAGSGALSTAAGETDSAGSGVTVAGVLEVCSAASGVTMGGVAEALCAGAASDVPQDKQNLFPTGFAALHFAQKTAAPLLCACGAGALTGLPHREQNLFVAGLWAPQLEHTNGWSDMLTP